MESFATSSVYTDVRLTVFQPRGRADETLIVYTVSLTISIILAASASLRSVRDWANDGTDNIAVNIMIKNVFIITSFDQSGSLFIVIAAYRPEFETRSTASGWTYHK